MTISYIRIILRTSFYATYQSTNSNSKQTTPRKLICAKNSHCQKPLSLTFHISPKLLLKEISFIRKTKFLFENPAREDPFRLFVLHSNLNSLLEHINWKRLV